MKTQIVLLALLIISTSAMTADQCSKCSQLMSQADCNVPGTCTWSTTCVDKTTTPTTPDCTKTNQADCDTIHGCGWTTGTTPACAKFTKCEDYSVTTASQCYSKDVTCYPGTATGTTTPCVTADITKCSTIKDQTLCTNNSCNWANAACAAPTCAGVTAQAQCTSVRADSETQVQICAWGTACADATSVTGMTSANCLTNTGGSYTWDGTTCTACSSSSNAMLLSFIGLLAMLMF